MNLSLLLSRAARAHPDRPALVQGDRILNYEEFNRRTGRLAGALRDLGVRMGDRVAILQHNAPPFLETLFALFRLGAVAVPINVRLHPREVRYILEQSRTAAVIHGDFINPRISQARRETSVRHWISTGDRASTDTFGYEDLLAQTSELPDDVELEENALAWLFYTSGTTGKPKGAMLSHRNLLAMTMSFFADHFVPDETDVALHAAPLSHGSGLYALPLVARGVSNILHDSVGFSPALVFEEITRWKVTLIPFSGPHSGQATGRGAGRPRPRPFQPAGHCLGRSPHVRGRRPAGCLPLRAHPDRALRTGRVPHDHHRPQPAGHGGGTGEGAGAAHGGIAAHRRGSPRRGRGGHRCPRAAPARSWCGAAWS